MDANKPDIKRWRTHGLASAGLGCGTLFAAFIAAGIAPWALPADGCFSALLAAVTVGLVDAVLARRAWYARRLAVCRLALVTLAAAATLSIGMVMGIGGETRAFREIFGKAPPSGVKGLAGQREYAGLYDRDDILLRFVADEPTLRKVMADRGFVQDTQAVLTYKASTKTWAQFCDEVLWQPSGKYGAWLPSTPMAAPVVYTLRDSRMKELAIPDTVVLWDAATGQAYVHRLGG